MLHVGGAPCVRVSHSSGLGRILPVICLVGCATLTRGGVCDSTSQTEVHSQKRDNVVVVFAYQPALVLDPEPCCEADVSSWRLVGEEGGSESPAWGSRAPASWLSHQEGRIPLESVFPASK